MPMNAQPSQVVRSNKAHGIAFMKALIAPSHLAERPEAAGRYTRYKRQRKQPERRQSSRRFFQNSMLQRTFNSSKYQFVPAASPLSSQRQSKAFSPTRAEPRAILTNNRLRKDLPDFTKHAAMLAATTQATNSKSQRTTYLKPKAQLDQNMQFIHGNKTSTVIEAFQAAYVTQSNSVDKLDKHRNSRLLNILKRSSDQGQQHAPKNWKNCLNDSATSRQKLLIGAIPDHQRCIRTIVFKNDPNDLHKPGINEGLFSDDSYHPKQKQALQKEALN